MVVVLSTTAQYSVSVEYTSHFGFATSFIPPLDLSFKRWLKRSIVGTREPQKTLGTAGIDRTAPNRLQRSVRPCLGQNEWPEVSKPPPPTLRDRGLPGATLPHS